MFLKMLRKKWLPLMLIMLFVPSVLLAGCGPSTSQTSQTPAPKSLPITVGYIPGLQYVPLFVMTQEGIDKKYNLQVKLQQFASPQAEYTAARGQAVDVSADGWLTIALLRTQGVPLTMIYPSCGFTVEVLVKKGSPIKDISDLKGKKIGVFGGPADTTAILFQIIGNKYYGFDPLKENQVFYGAAGMLANELATGQIDAALLMDPVISQLLDTGKYVGIANLGDIWKQKTGQDLLLLALTTDDNFVKEHPETLKAFVAAYKDSIDYMNTHDSIWPAFANTVGIKTASGAKILQSRISSKYYTQWNKDSLPGLEQFASTYNQFAPKGAALTHFPTDAFNFDFVPAQ